LKTCPSINTRQRQLQSWPTTNPQLLPLQLLLLRLQKISTMILLPARRSPRANVSFDVPNFYLHLVCSLCLSQFTNHIPAVKRRQKQREKDAKRAEREAALPARPAKEKKEGEKELTPNVSTSYTLSSREP
jgi:hypothetical protein